MNQAHRSVLVRLSPTGVHGRFAARAPKPYCRAPNMSSAISRQGEMVDRRPWIELNRVYGSGGLWLAAHEMNRCRLPSPLTRLPTSQTEIFSNSCLHRLLPFSLIYPPDGAGAFVCRFEGAFRVGSRAGRFCVGICELYKTPHPRAAMRRAMAGTWSFGLSPIKHHRRCP